jgi:hypothetical protein
MITGRWDSIIRKGPREYAAWFEIFEDKGEYKGRYVGIEGSQRPMREVYYKNKELYFRLPPQYEKHSGDLVFKGRLYRGKITGETNDPQGNWISFIAVPAPKLEPRQLNWKHPTSLIEGSLNNWEKRYHDRESGWRIQDGILSNKPPSVDIMTKKRFSDFNLQGEFRVPENGNSGIYLRGRYEV